MLLRRIGTGPLGEYRSNRCEFGFDPCELLLDALLPVRPAMCRCLWRVCVVRGTDVDQHDQ